MFRIRFHGRGGQGVKTASRILGTAFFLEGYEVQDAPRYGAERRGAPIFAYVRAGKTPIHERGVIARPGLVAVADDTLMGISAAGVMEGVDGDTVLLIVGKESEATWRDRLKTEARIVTLEPFAIEEISDRPYVGAACAGAAARLVGVLSEENLKQALSDELSPHGEKVVARNLDHALKAFEAVKEAEGAAGEASGAEGAGYTPPGWIDLPLETADVSAPAIHAAATSVQVRTGLWRTMRPVLDKALCKKCVWVCGSFCPDGVIVAGADGYPDIDYDHCKGCMVCLAQCPAHAFEAQPERAAMAAEGGKP